MHQKIWPPRLGQLTCASCNPTGARPRGIEYGKEGNVAIPNMPLAGGNGVWGGGEWLAGHTSPLADTVSFDGAH